MKNDTQHGLLGPAILHDGTAEADPRAFRTCLGQFATGVTVMAAGHDGRPVGLTAGSFSSLSLDPPLILWSIGRSSRSFAVFAQAPSFNVNVLADDQIDISQHFGSSADDKFSGIEWFRGRNGCPVLPGIVALFESEREAVYDGGDHLIIIGRVRRFVRYAGKPLLFVQSRYGVPQTHPRLQASDETLAAAPAPTQSIAALLSSMLEATRLQVGGFDKHRRAEALNYIHTRVLFDLGLKSSQAIADLARRIFAVPADCEDAVAELIERGLVVKDLKGQVSLTEAGRQKNDAVMRRYEHYEEECLSGFSADEIAGVKAFLDAFIRKFKSASPEA